MKQLINDFSTVNMHQIAPVDRRGSITGFQQNMKVKLDQVNSLCAVFNRSMTSIFTYISYNGGSITV